MAIEYPIHTWGHRRTKYMEGGDPLQQHLSTTSPHLYAHIPSTIKSPPPPHATPPQFKQSTWREATCSTTSQRGASAGTSGAARCVVGGWLDGRQQSCRGAIQQAGRPVSQQALLGTACQPGANEEGQRHTPCCSASCPPSPTLPTHPHSAPPHSQIAMDVARGLVFLHSKRIVHFDLKMSCEQKWRGWR